MKICKHIINYLVKKEKNLGKKIKPHMIMKEFNGEDQYISI
jgi:hypothetical protein